MWLVTSSETPSAALAALLSVPRQRWLASMCACGSAPPGSAASRGRRVRPHAERSVLEGFRVAPLPASPASRGIELSGPVCASSCAASEPQRACRHLHIARASGAAVALSFCSSTGSPGTLRRGIQQRNTHLSGRRAARPARSLPDHSSRPGNTTALPPRSPGSLTAHGLRSHLPLGAEPLRQLAAVQRHGGGPGSC